jgi:c-di-GMP-binding flagellar brake protein YcgR
VLLKNKNLLTAKCSENNASFVTTVLDVDKKAKVFICDGCDDDLTEQMLSSRKIFFKTEHLGAAVTFDTPQFTKTKYQGNPAFSVPVPSTLRWLEHREYYRMRVPANHKSHCEVVLENHGPAKLKLYDISIRGFSVLNTSEGLSEALPAYARFNNCKLILDEKHTANVSFEVRSKFLINPDGLNPADKIGCKFIGVSTTLENTIHSYMMAIERELLKKRLEKTTFF